MDIMLDLDELRPLDHSKRRRLIAARILEEVPAVLTKYAIADFDQTRFIEDLRAWIAAATED